VTRPRRAQAPSGRASLDGERQQVRRALALRLRRFSDAFPTRPRATDTEAPAVQAHAFALRQKRAATAHQELRCVAVPTRALCQRVSLQSAR
jgi:hypothetical protein